MLRVKHDATGPLLIESKELHFDAGRSEQAQAALAEAESSYLASANAIPKPLQQIVHDSLTFYTAEIRRSVAAR